MTNVTEIRAALVGHILATYAVMPSSEIVRTCRTLEAYITSGTISEPPTAADETNPSLDDLLSDVQAIKCAIMAYQEGQGHGGHIDAAYRSMDEAWGHLMLIKATDDVAP